MHTSRLWQGLSFDTTLFTLAHGSRPPRIYASSPLLSLSKDQRSSGLLPQPHLEPPHLFVRLEAKLFNVLLTTFSSLSLKYAAAEQLHVSISLKMAATSPSPLEALQVGQRRPPSSSDASSSSSSSSSDKFSLLQNLLKLVMPLRTFSTSPQALLQHTSSFASSPQAYSLVLAHHTLHIATLSPSSSNTYIYTFLHPTFSTSNHFSAHS